MIILDTNVISELTRQTPAPGVLSWLDSLAVAEIATTAITAAELLYGVARLPDGRRKTELAAAVDGLLNDDFQGRVLSFGEPAARRYAGIVSGRERLAGLSVWLTHRSRPSAALLTRHWRPATPMISRKRKSNWSTHGSLADYFMRGWDRISAGPAVTSDQVQPLPTAVARMIREAVAEYETGQTPEARCARDSGWAAQCENLMRLRRGNHRQNDRHRGTAPGWQTASCEQVSRESR